MDKRNSDKKSQIWLRAETKAFEYRTPLTPADAGKLVESGHQIHVEESTDRVFADQEYLQAGCKLEPAGSWQNAPLGAYILGLKELPEEIDKIKHKHIYFAHAYKNQADAGKTLKKFENGGGTIYDLEYLLNENRRRAVAFGKWAGFIGAALGVDIFCHQQRSPGETYPGITKSFNSIQLSDILSEKLSFIENDPRTIIIGAKGESGQGATELFNSINLKATEWGVQETKNGGPFKEIIGYNILVNCVLVRGKISPFLETNTLKLPERRLSVIADVSCNPGNPNNPLPIYNNTTTFEHPTHRLISGVPPLDLLAIDHLPSLLPAESSTDFSKQLLPHLRTLLESKELPKIWQGAKAHFDKNIKLI
jgi:saccharopine dehydrogenase (NAD+, L-lysine-forming)